ncbi:MAG: hypothetical protein DKM23_02320 [Candidatus Melainabacteria bacterium]|nr:MAG: hypothetical protein DKM24_00195 [Candidatus Melainabacteria bacterium]RAI13897.1 MAG: hypothetical protein DKM23_02320 [Candidatus Melainabacteria bacterium]
MKAKKIIIIAILMAFFVPSMAHAAIFKKEEVVEQQARSNYPPKYDDIYLEQLKKEYRKISSDEVILVALDMMKNTTADFSRRALIGYNLTDKPVKVQFKDLSQIKEDYQNFDALGWKKKNQLYIFINPRHADAPPAALAALLAHEALHQDEYNSLAEETYAWTMEAAVWSELLEIYPEQNDRQHPLLQRENTLRQLFKKGGYTDRYIRKTVYANKGYQNLPQTSPGFERL